MMAPSIGVNLRVTGHCNQGGRKYMEDAFVVAYQQSEDGKDLEYAYFGIFDGHGGKEAALFAKEHLMNNIVCQKTFWSDDDEQVLKAIRDGFLITHRAMWKEVGNWPKTISGLPSTSGTTSSIAFIRKRKLYIGHVGDSKIVIGCQEPGLNEWTAIPLTKDHKPETPKEKQRIYSVGGLVMNKAGVERVVWNRPRPGHKGPVRRSTPLDQIPFLAVARSLGDLWSYNYMRREFVVSPDPDVAVCNLDPRRDRCIVFASDGLWNMLTTKSAVRIVQKAEEENEKMILEGGGPNGVGKPANNPSKLLVDCALNHWFELGMRADNTSVVTVMLDPPGPPKCEVLLRQKVMQKLRPRDDQADLTTAPSSPAENSSERKFTAEKCAELLYWAKEPHRRTLGEACKYGDIITVRKFLDEGANVNEVMRDGKTLLSIACASGHIGVAELLLSRKAKLEERSLKGLTPVMEAIAAGHMKIVKLLAQHGADTNTKPSQGHIASSLPKPIVLPPTRTTENPADSELADGTADSSTGPSEEPSVSSTSKDKRKSCESSEPQSSKDRKRPADGEADSAPPSKERRLSSDSNDNSSSQRKGLPKPVILSPQKIFRKLSKSSPLAAATPSTNSPKPGYYSSSLIDVRSKKKGHEPPGEMENRIGMDNENVSDNTGCDRCAHDSSSCVSPMDTSNSPDTARQCYPQSTNASARTVRETGAQPPNPKTKDNGRIHLCEVDNIVPVDYIERLPTSSPTVQRIAKEDLNRSVPSTRSVTSSRSSAARRRNSLHKLRLHHRGAPWKSRTLVGYRTVSLRKDLPHITRAQNRIRKLKL